jgi:hypothetical protein
MLCGIGLRSDDPVDEQVDAGKENQADGRGRTENRRDVGSAETGKQHPRCQEASHAIACRRR